MYYRMPYTIPNFICDNHDRLAAWGCARLLQQAADGHTDLFGIGFRQLQEQHKAWVLCRTYYDVHRLPMDGDAVEVRTWSRSTDGLYAWRDFELTDGSGAVLVAATTSWVVIDTDSRRVARLGEIVRGFESHADCATDAVLPRRLRFPQGEKGELVAERQPVRHSMLDHTQHMNNAEYVRWIADSLPGGEGVAAPFELDVEYLQETRPGETVDIRRLRQPDGSLMLRIDNPRATAVVATYRQGTAANW